MTTTTSLAPQVHTKTKSEVVSCSVGFLGKLDAGELLSGAPTVVEVTSTDLTIDNVSANPSTVVIDRETHLANQAVQFRVAGGVAYKRYRIRVSCGTNASPANTRIVSVRINVVQD
jgi:hypothetical protein